MEHADTLQNLRMNTPLLKWTGSKRHLSQKIISYFPHSVHTYYEPFLGGGSVFFALLRSNINVKNFELSDINESLIHIFTIVKETPHELIASYADKWEKLQKDATFYYAERERFNQTYDPYILYFLSRTGYNGTIRYNKKGEFNTSHHFGRPGMRPHTVKKVIEYYSLLMKNKCVRFTCSSFDDITPQYVNDVVYMDPPYERSRSLYFGNVNIDALTSWVHNLPCSWFMTFNGISRIKSEECLPIPFTGSTILFSGNSSFSRMKGKQVNVGEYLYYRHASL